MKRTVGKLDRFILDQLSGGRYSVTAAGSVFDRARNRIVPSRETDNGYLRCTLMPRVGHGKEVMVHRVVALSRRGTPAIGLDCDHRDGNKKNNTPENLEFVERGENERRAYRLNLRKPAGMIGRKGSAHHRAKLSEQQVIDARARYARGERNQYELAAELGVSQPAVSLLVRGINWGCVPAVRP